MSLVKSILKATHDVLAEHIAEGVKKHIASSVNETVKVNGKTYKLQPMKMQDKTILVYVQQEPEQVKPKPLEQPKPAPAVQSQVKPMKNKDNVELIIEEKE